MNTMAQEQRCWYARFMRGQRTTYVHDASTCLNPWCHLNPPDWVHLDTEGNPMPQETTDAR